MKRSKIWGSSYIFSFFQLPGLISIFQNELCCCLSVKWGNHKSSFFIIYFNSTLFFPSLLLTENYLKKFNKVAPPVLKQEGAWFSHVFFYYVFSSYLFEFRLRAILESKQTVLEKHKILLFLLEMFHLL